MIIDYSKIPIVKVSFSLNVNSEDLQKISCSIELYDLLKHFWKPGNIEYIEEVKLILLNRGNKVLGIADISKGGISGTVMDIRVILQHALLANSSAIILAHNHPSGNLQPSEQDKKITHKINEAAKLMDIKLLDHMIISSNGYYSMSNEGNL